MGDIMYFEMRLCERCSKCTGEPVLLKPDEFHDYFTILCGNEPFKHDMANGDTIEEAVSNWNQLQGD